MIKEGLVDCMVALPTQLFYNTQIPACLWFLARNRKNHKFRDRSKEILFIDARNLGYMVNRTNKALSDEDLKKISDTYHRWRNKNGKYKDIKGFCKSSSLKEIEENGFVLTPGRYVGTEAAIHDSISYDEQIANLAEKLKDNFENQVRLQKSIQKNLRKIGIEI